jgi:hypothetical protein
LNYQFTAVGGCQQKVTKGQDVLWAFNAFNAQNFLKLTGPELAFTGYPAVYTVTDGATGLVVEGATVGGGTTNSSGEVALTFNRVGVRDLKAEKANAIRSNAVVTVVI